MWTVDCIAKITPAACSPLRRPPVCVVPSYEIAAEHARTQVKQLRKSWAQSEVAIISDNAEQPFSCDVHCVDTAGNAAVYHFVVRQLESMVDQLQMEQMTLSVAALTPTGGAKRTKSVMISSDVKVSLLSPQSDSDSRESGNMSDADVKVEPRASCVRAKFARSGTSSTVGFGEQ